MSQIYFANISSSSCITVKPYTQVSLFCRIHTQKTPAQLHHDTMLKRSRLFKTLLLLLHTTKEAVCLCVVFVLLKKKKKGKKEEKRKRRKEKEQKEMQQIPKVHWNKKQYAFSSKNPKYDGQCRQQILLLYCWNRQLERR